MTPFNIFYLCFVMVFTIAMLIWCVIMLKHIKSKTPIDLRQDAKRSLFFDFSYLLFMIVTCLQSVLNFYYNDSKIGLTCFFINALIATIYLRRSFPRDFAALHIKPVNKDASYYDIGIALRKKDFLKHHHLKDFPEDSQEARCYDCGRPVVFHKHFGDKFAEKQLQESPDYHVRLLCKQCINTPFKKQYYTSLGSLNQKLKEFEQVSKELRQKADELEKEILASKK